MERWTKASNYIGEDYSEYWILYGRNRDSDTLVNSNYDSILADLGGESETVLVVRAGHWACGWIELILIHESDAERVKQGHEITKCLEDYPVYDDQAFSDAEYEETESLFSSFGSSDIDREIERSFGESFLESLKRSKHWDHFKFSLWREIASYYGVDQAHIPNRPKLMDMIDMLWIPNCRAQAPIHYIRQRILNLNSKLYPSLKLVGVRS